MSSIQVMPGSVQANMLQDMLDMACQWVQNAIGKPVAPTTFDRRFDGNSGWSGAYIMLPYYPVLEVVRVTEYWGLSGPHVLEEQIPTDQVDGWQLDYLTGTLSRVFPGLVVKPWFPGARSVEVTWTAGYNPVPADLKIATRELVAYWWRNTQQAPRSARNAYGESADNSNLWPAIPDRIRALLNPYLSVGIG
jgi:hypothetical protein